MGTITRENTRPHSLRTTDCKFYSEDPVTLKSLQARWNAQMTSDTDVITTVFFPFTATLLLTLKSCCKHLTVHTES